VIDLLVISRIRLLIRTSGVKIITIIDYVT
jgi:hypothetical protein